MKVGKDPLVRPLTGHCGIGELTTGTILAELDTLAQDRQEERSKMAGDTNGNKTRIHQFKEQLVKAARMYTMCRKSGVAEPLDVTALAVAAFEDMPLKQALVLVRSNEQNIKDLAWAFENSGSAAEFEQRVKEIKDLPSGRQPG